MVQLDQVVQKNAAASKEMTAAAVILKGEAVMFRETIQRFKIRD